MFHTCPDCQTKNHKTITVMDYLRKFANNNIYDSIEYIIDVFDLKEHYDKLKLFANN